MARLIKMFCVLLVLGCPAWAQNLADRSQQVIFDGLPHVALQGSQLEVVGSSLMVHSGSTGGFRVPMGEAGFLVTTPREIESQAMLVGSSLTIASTGTVNGVPGQSIGQVSLTNLGDAVEYWCDFSDIGATAATVQVLSGGEVVQTVSGLTGPVARIPGPIRCDPIDPVWPMDDPDEPIWAISSFAEPVPITITGQETVMGDQLVVIPEGVQGSVNAVTEMSFHTNNLPELVIERQQLGMFHAPHEALGNARLEAVGGNLQISNLGSSGNSGVAIDLGDVNYWTGTFLDDVFPESAPQGAGMAWAIRGSLAGQEDQVLTQGRWQVVGSEIQWFADSSAVGASAHRVQVLQKGRLVYEAIIPNDEPLYTTSSVCGGKPVWERVLGPDSLLCSEDITGDLDLQVNGISFPEGGTVQISAADPQQNVGPISRIELTGKDIPAITIGDESTTPPGKPQMGLESAQVVFELP